jgi:signal transduction histidine kinase
MAEDPNPILDELRKVAVIADVPESELIWLSGNLKEIIVAAGEILAVKGGPADTFHILLEGEYHFRYEDPQDFRVYVSKAGDIIGKLPYSRLTQWPGTVRAIHGGRMLVGKTDLYPDMTRYAPTIVQRMVGIMSDRIRSTTREDQQVEKLAALGKLSAGLAHELNNPAASAKRAALALSEAQDALREATSRLENRDLSVEQRKSITHFERQAMQRAQGSETLDALVQSEREEEITSWLEEHNVNEGWKFASVLTETGLDIEWLRGLQQAIGDEVLADALERIASQVLAKKLTKEIESSTGRISELVKAIKEYSFMDQAPLQEIDLHDGIENTLIIMRYKLKHGITIERNFDLSLPRICAYGSELNQIWTNLIDNAADSMKDGGKLTIRTSRDADWALIEISDTGAGIPKAIQSRIFEPFFTTKKMGEGTGLGLDAVWRIVRKHQGIVQVESKPGETRFQVRLPIKLNS